MVTASSLTHKSRTLRRKSSQGATLAFFAVTAAAIIGLMGIAIYTGLQAYFHNEVQQTATTAAMAGAAAYYSGGATPGQPQPNPGFAVNVANSVYSTIHNSSPAMQSFGAALAPAPSAAGNDSIKLGVQGSFDTPFLAVVGTTKMQVTGTAQARAIKYVPTDQTGPIELNAAGGSTGPNSTDNGSGYKIPLLFPMVDGKGTELVIYQNYTNPNTSVMQGYSVEACNQSTCYVISKPAAVALMPGSFFSANTASNGASIIYGGCYIDLREAGVNKATYLRIVDDNIYDVYYGTDHYFINDPTVKNVIERVEIYGYSSQCDGNGQCGIPAGFEATP